MIVCTPHRYAGPRGCPYCWSRRWKALAKRNREWLAGADAHNQVLLRASAAAARHAKLWKRAAKLFWRALKWEYVQALRERRIQIVLKCADCGLSNAREPTVDYRIDGNVRCNNCHAIWEGWRPPRGKELEWKEWLR